MSSLENAGKYLALAEQLYTGHLVEDNLRPATHTLPTLTQTLLDHLSTQAAEKGLYLPRHGWAIAAVADAAARAVSDPFLQAQAAWVLARAANGWVRPERVAEALERARAGFMALDRQDWLAACRWQQYALPWTGDDFQAAANELSQALSVLQQSGLREFVPYCHISLAYAQLLQAGFADALENAESAEKRLQAAGDRYGLALCHLLRSSCYRRQMHHRRAVSCLESAQEIFEQLEMPMGLAWSHFQLGYSLWQWQTDFVTSEEHFLEAAKTFHQLDLPLWAGQCFTGLAMLYNDRGRLADAGRMLARAWNIYSEYNVPGLRADNLLDTGYLELLRGRYSASLTYIQEARLLYERLGAASMTATAMMYIGEVYSGLGRYQQALEYLEAAHKVLAALDNPGRLAECELHLGQTWLYLDRPEQAQLHLEQAATLSRAENRTFLPEIYNLLALTYFGQGQMEKATIFLQEQLAAAHREDHRPQIAMTTRLLGEVLAAAGQTQKALLALEEAQAHFAEMGLVNEKARCQIAFGYALESDNQVEAARSAWEAALQMDRGLTPDIAWQTHAGLARLAEAAGNETLALAYYRQMAVALRQLRRWFWQPALAGSFLRQPAAALAEAITLAVRQGAVNLALALIEESKAQTVVRQLASDGQLHQPVTASAGQLDDLEADLRWLDREIGASMNANPGWKRPDEEVALRQRRLRARITYARLRDRLEREAGPGHEAGQQVSDFVLDHFREQALLALGEDTGWVAVDYFLAGNTLHTVLVTADSCLAWSSAIPDRAQQILGLETGLSLNWQQLSEHDLQVLGSWLLPAVVSRELTSHTHLIIAPHDRLHGLPWAALAAGEAKQSLVECCIPTIIPSLQSLGLLWERPQAPAVPRDAGLVVAADDFQGRRSPLPQALAEGRRLAAQLSPDGAQLLGEEATWPRVKELAGEDGLGRFSFLHFAGHAFHDQVNGRLSGFSLHDRDVWLDEFWVLTPAPALVSLSACSGVQSRVYPGDEHVSLAVTCLAAGARHVIGSLWPVRDDDAMALMIEFYQYFLAGEEPAKALALAQRALAGQGLNTLRWGTFCCLGAP